MMRQSMPLGVWNQILHADFLAAHLLSHAAQLASLLNEAIKVFHMSLEEVANTWKLFDIMGFSHKA